MSVAAVEFVGVLEKSNLLSTGQVEAVRTEIAGASNIDPKILAQRLVKEGLLTRWQAGMLLAGRSSFFLGKYKLLAELGRGGMGAVFKAEQRPLGRIVALKVMSAKLVKDKVAVGRFHREIQAAAALNHPNIVAAYDADQVQNTHFLVMEFVEGEDLDVIAKRGGKVPVGTACEYIRQAALGLQHAHERGMAHRDIKLSNLLLTRRNDNEPLVKILDMGLARFTSETGEDGGLTQTGQIMGTPDYISPEQAKSTKSADIRSDIYSLGCCLFRLLTGELPFKGSNVMEKLMARAMSDAPALRSLLPHAPAELEAVVSRMLARDPQQRFQTPADLAAALSPFSSIATTIGGDTPHPSPVRSLPSHHDSSQEISLAAAIDTGMGQFLQNLANEAAQDEAPAVTMQSISDTQVGEQGQGNAESLPAAMMTRAGQKLQSQIERRKAADRKRLVLTLAGVAAGVALVAGLVIWQKLGVTTLIVDWPADERRGGTLEVDSRNVALSEAGDIVLNGEPGTRFVRMLRPGFYAVDEKVEFGRGERKSVQPQWKPTPATVRQREWSALKSEIAEVLKAIGAVDFEQENPQASALAGQLRAFRKRWPGSAEIEELRGLQTQLPWPLDRLQSDPSRLPTHELALLGTREAAQAPTHVLAAIGDSRFVQGTDVVSLAAAPVEDVIATSGNNGFVHLWNSRTGEILRSMSTEGATAWCLDFSPDGARLAAGCGDGIVRIWTVDDGKKLVEYRAHQAPVHCIDFHPQGRLLASGGNDHHVTVWDGEAQQQIRSFRANDTDQWGVWSLEFSPEGALLAVANEDRTVKLYSTGTWEAEHTFTGFGSSVHSVAFSPDGKLLVSGTWESGLYVWDLRTRMLLQQLSGQGQSVRSLVFSADGAMLATGSHNFSTLLWNVATWEVAATIADNSQWLKAIGFTNGGQHLAIGTTAGLIRLWKLPEATLVNEPAPSPACVAVTPDGSRIYSGLRDGSIHWWDAATLAPLGNEQLNRGPVFRLAVSDDGELLAAGTEYGSIVLWHIGHGRPLRYFEHGGKVHSLRFSPPGDTLFSGSYQADKTFKVWNTSTGKMTHADLSADTDGATVVWMAHSPDGTILATSDDQGHVALRDPKSGRQQSVINWPMQQVRTLEFGRKPNTVVTSSAYAEPEVLGFNLKEKRAVFRSSIHTDGVPALAISPDRSEFVTASHDGTARLWNADTGELKTTLLGSAGRLEWVVYSPCGRHVVIASARNVIYVLRLRGRRP